MLSELCFTFYNFLFAALPCSSFRFKSDLSALLLRCTILYATVFELWINKFKGGLKMSVSLVLVTEYLKL